jgi:hypothetical protein
VGYVLDGGPQAALVLADRIVLRSGEKSPLGHPITHISPPLLGGLGQTAVLLETSRGQELAFRGDGFHTVLATGDTVGGKAIGSMLAGVLPSQLEAQARLAFVLGFTDGQRALVVGEPV